MKRPDILGLAGERLREWLDTFDPTQPAYIVKPAIERAIGEIIGLIEEDPVERAWRRELLTQALGATSQGFYAAALSPISTILIEPALPPSRAEPPTIADLRSLLETLRSLPPKDHYPRPNEPAY